MQHFKVCHNKMFFKLRFCLSVKKKKKEIRHESLHGNRNDNKKKLKLLSN